MPAHSHSWSNEVPVLVPMLLCARDVSIMSLTPFFTARMSLRQLGQRLCVWFGYCAFTVSLMVQGQFIRARSYGQSLKRSYLISSWILKFINRRGAIHETWGNCSGFFSGSTSSKFGAKKSIKKNP